MKKKLLSVLLTAVMTVSVCLTGCGNEEQKETSTPSPEASKESQSSQASEEVPAEPELEDVELNVWLVGVGKQKDSDAVWDYFNEQLEEYLPNTTVNFTAFSFDEYATKWSTAMAAGEQVDLAWFGWVQNQDKEIEMGTLTPLSDLVDTYCQDAVELFGKDGLDMHRYKDGELYIFPCWQGLGVAFNCVTFQKDTVELMEDGWLENFQKMCLEYGSSTDVEDHRKVYEEFTRYLQTCKENGMLKNGTTPSVLASWNNQAYANGTLGNKINGRVKIGDNEFTLVPDYSNELYKLNWEYNAKWYEEGYIRQDIASVEKGYNEFTVGDPENSVLTYAGGSLSKNFEKDFNAKYDMELVSVRVDDTNWISPSPATCWCIPTTTVDAERSAMLMNLLNGESGKELYQTLVYGIEGTHWTDNGDGTATTLCGDGQPTADWAYGQVNWVMGNVQNSLVTQTDTEGEWEYRSSREVDALQNPLKVAGFSMDISAIEAQHTNLVSIQTKYASMFDKGYLGADFEKEYANYQKELKDAGIEEYIAEMQKQIDALVAERGLAWK